MKKLLYLFFALGLAISACGTAATQPAPPAQTGTPTVTATTTQTPTITITPLPTIPTFTPTFDVSTIVTVTPAEKAECPTQKTKKPPSFLIRTKENHYIENSKEILEYLNQGGDLAKVFQRLFDAAQPSYESVFQGDLTGDSEDELVFIDFSSEPKLHIFSCVNGQYINFNPNINLTGYSEAISFEIDDLNKNGLPDIILLTSCSRAPLCGFLTIFEWNGSVFSNLIEPIEIFEGSLEKEIKDTNNDGIKELLIRHDVRGDSAYFNGFPWRVSTHIYVWNGNYYALQNTQYAKPEFRFQALHDADRFTLVKDINYAMMVYDLVVSDKKLQPYSRELSEHMKWLFENPLSLGVATQPPADPTEYPRLAAYAYYRIILLHLAQGQEAEAASTYQTLLSTFGNDPYAAPYAEMATAFWEAYQPTNKMYDGCAAAIQYAVEHPEILIPLGSDYHGWQAKIYQPADVCPFR